MKLKVICAAALCAITASAAQAKSAVTLRVAMYPYVPEAEALFHELEEEFEARHAGVNVELVDSYRDPGTGKEASLSWNYYSGGLIAAEADVYEVDTVLLQDMVDRGKISEIDLPDADFATTAVSAVTLGGHVWGVPHWMCGDFLFYRKGDDIVAQAKSWSELIDAIGHDSLLIDLKGSSTLGEWYITALAMSGVTSSDILKIVAAGNIDQRVVDRLTAALDLCPAGLCRNDTLHDRAGYYGRMFARGRARAYIGYSESLFYLFSELQESCGPSDGCLGTDDISVRALPGDRGDVRIGWVDALCVASRLTKDRARLAREFISFASSREAYQKVLNPARGQAPRYLLPALSIGADFSLEPALYPSLVDAFGERTTLSASGLSRELRALGKLLNCALPAERTDKAFLRDCGQEE